jgi:hypothetical protein
VSGDKGEVIQFGSGEIEGHSAFPGGGVFNGEQK